MGYSDSSGARPTGGGRAIEIVPLRDVTPSTRLVYDEPQPPEPPAEEGGAEAWRMLGVLAKRKFLIAAVVVLGTALAAMLTLRETPIYAAATTLEVQARETEIIQGAGVDPAVVADAEFMGTQLALLRSRALAERIAESLNLASEPLYANPQADAETRLAQATGAVARGVSVSTLRGARVIQVTYESPSRTEAARIANAVAENFIELNLERRFNATAYAREFLEERIATTKTSLEVAERRLVQYSRDKEILDLSSVGGSELGSSLDASALVSLSASLTEAQNQRIIAEQRYREAASNSNTREMLESAALATLRETRSQLMSEYQLKLTDFYPEAPEMRSLKARIDSVEQQMGEERTNIMNAIEGEYRAAVAREQALSARVGELREDVQGLRSRSIDYNILAREVDTLRTQYDALLQRFKEISISSGVGSSQVSILDLAQAPGRPIKPDLQGSLIRAAMISLALAIGLAFLIEFLDDTIKTPEDVNRKLKLRVVGVIPRVKSREPISKLISNPRAEVTEAFSSTRTALQFSILSGSLKSLLVTGSKPGEGKTSTTLALGSSFALIGKKVLIIDADLRRPSFAFSAEASQGLSGVLSKGLPLMPNVVLGPTDNLFLLPSGRVPHNPAELLASTRLLQIIEEASDHFDLVLIDSPPVLTFADAPTLSAVCDATLLIVQSGGIRRQAALRAIERLDSARGKVTGVILTKFDAKKAGYGRSYGYGYRGYSETDFKKLESSPASSRRQIKHFVDGATSHSDDAFD
jgi:succinoglycan biosynthesis transport protein ExoP